MTVMNSRRRCSCLALCFDVRAARACGRLTCYVVCACCNDRAEQPAPLLLTGLLLGGLICCGFSCELREPVEV